ITPDVDILRVAGSHIGDACGGAAYRNWAEARALKRTGFPDPEPSFLDPRPGHCRPLSAWDVPRSAGQSLVARRLVQPAGRLPPGFAPVVSVGTSRPSSPESAIPSGPKLAADREQSPTNPAGSWPAGTNACHHIVAPSKHRNRGPTSGASCRTR